VCRPRRWPGRTEYLTEPFQVHSSKHRLAGHRPLMAKPLPPASTSRTLVADTSPHLGLTSPGRCAANKSLDSDSRKLFASISLTNPFLKLSSLSHPDVYSLSSLVSILVPPTSSVRFFFPKSRDGCSSMDLGIHTITIDRILTDRRFPPMDNAINLLSHPSKCKSIVQCSTAQNRTALSCRGSMYPAMPCHHVMIQTEC
jgi:hypothetical protein